MEVSVALWSVRSILDIIPFDSPAIGNAVHLDCSKLAVPYYVKNIFKISIFYVDDTYPADATCSIYSPKNMVTVIFIIKRKYEDNFRSWLVAHEEKHLDLCCRRRELYCHETAHLVAIIRAYPSYRSSKVREDFLVKLRAKFSKSINTAQNTRSTPLVSMENPGESPSVFDKDHFRYNNDSLNFFLLYQELMLPYDRMVDSINLLAEKYRKTKSITFDDVAKETFVAKNFFDTFPEKLTAFQELLSEILIN